MQNAKTLNPILLGRPVQAFDQLAQQLAQRVENHLQRTGHRTIAIRIEHTHFIPQRGAAPQKIHIQLQRGTVLAHMAARYGFLPDSTQPDARISSTERRIDAALQEAMYLAATEMGEQARTALTHHPVTSASAWEWQAQIQVADNDWHPLSIALDMETSQVLEHYALQMRSSQNTTTNAHHQPAAALHVELTAQLLEKTVTTADIQALRTGCVLPIAMGRATVLLNGEALLCASVAEHHGKLNLTAFETLE